MKDYWNIRFKDGKVWGTQPSESAKKARVIFGQANINEVLVIGSGYGRHTNYFYREGFDVEGIEYTLEGIKLAEKDGYNIKYYHGSVFDMPFRDKKYQSIYCFNVLHLFKKDERKVLLELCKKVLEKDGMMYFTSFSEQEKSYRIGQEIEFNTYESKVGKPIHYYTDEDMRDEFSEYTLMDTGLFIDKENHGDEGEHDHILRYVVVKNR